MKTIESKIAPNPKEAQIWIDLSADAHGLVKKYWNGKKWIAKESTDNTEVIKSFSLQLGNLENKINQIVNQFNSQLNNLRTENIKLQNKIANLEKAIV